MPRLDLTLVERGLAPTRSRALDLIRRGFVCVGGVVVTKPAAEIAASTSVTLADAAPTHVSRGAEKLIAALDHFGFDPGARACADIGASTGGFTEILLARGAAHVTAIDVGRDQLHVRLRADPRVTVLEATDARTLTAAHFPSAPSALVADVSFISLEKALPAVLGLAAPGAWLVALIKPQFEVGRDHIGKGGIVRDTIASDAAVARIALWLENAGWTVAGTVPSPITGGDGNQEFLIGAHKGATERHE
jgi:23S rRNA (cytidine1920-2'-O)/16S rRNA (cytidine1409-2'-O)-methyltransferase